MSKSNTEEIIGLLCFMLATQTVKDHRFITGILIAHGTISIAASIYYAIKDN